MCIYVHFVHQKLDEDFGFPGNGFIDDYEPRGGCWELNLDLLWGQQVLLITESSLQPLLYYFLKENCCLPSQLDDFCLEYI